MKEEELTQYLDIVQRLYAVEEEIRELKGKRQGVIADTVKGSSAGYPYTQRMILITGYDLLEHQTTEKRIMSLEKRRESLLLRLPEAKEKIYDAVNIAPDSLTKKILRMKYLEGMSQRTISKKLFIDQSTISRKIKRYLERCE